MVPFVGQSGLLVLIRLPLCWCEADHPLILGILPYFRHHFLFLSGCMNVSSVTCFYCLSRLTFVILHRPTMSCTWLPSGERICCLQSCLRQFLEQVRNGNVGKIVKVTNKGLDPNFHDQDSGGM